MSEVLGTAYIDIVARVNRLSEQARRDVSGALAGAQASASGISRRIDEETGKGTRAAEKHHKRLGETARYHVGQFSTNAFGFGPDAVAVAAIGATVGLSVKAAASFQESVTRISNSAQISQKVAGQTGQAFLDTAGKTTFSANQIAAAYAPIAGVFRTMYGHSLTAAQAVTVMDKAQKLAEASGSDLTSTTKGLVQTMLAYHVPLKQIGKTQDIVYNTSRNLGVGTQDLFSQFQRLAPRLAGTGTTVGQTAALFQELAKQVGTGRFALRTAGIALQNLITPSAGAKKALAEVGITLTNAHGKFIGIEPAIKKIHDAIAKLPAGQAGLAAATKLQGNAAELARLQQEKQSISLQVAALQTEHHTKALTEHINLVRRGSVAIDAQIASIKAQNPALQAQAASLNKNGLLTALFGRQSNIMAGIIAGGVPALHKAEQATGKTGTTQKAAERIAHTFGGTLRTLRSTVSDLGVELGTKLLPFVTKVAQGLNEYLVPAVNLVVGVLTTMWHIAQDTVGFFRDNATVFEIVGAAIGGILIPVVAVTAATAAWTAITNFAAAATMAFRGAMLVLNIVLAANPILLIVAAVAALAAAFIVAYYKIKPFHDAVDAVGRAIKHGMIDAFDAVKTAVTTVIGFITGHWKLLVPILLVITGPIGLIVAAAVLLGKHWAAVWHGMLQVSGFIVGTIIQDVIKPIVSAFLSFAQSIIGSAADAFGWVPGIGGKLKKARHAIDGFKSDSDKTMQGWANSAFSLGDSFGNNLSGGVDQALAKSKTADKAGRLSEQIIKNMRVSAHVASPSRHTLYTGEMIVEGLLRPIEQGIGRASDAAGRLTGAAIGGRVPNRHLAVGGGAAARGGDGAELLDELRALRMELVAQRTYFADLVRATRGLPSGIGHEITKAGDYRFAPRELRTN